jgi:hypothetical protein
MNSGLESIVLPNRLKTINDALFAFCHNLEYIIVPDSVINVGDRVFVGTEWLSKQPHNKVIYAGKVAYGFNGEIPETIELKEGALSIADGAFFNAYNLRNITIPESVIHIGEDAFSGYDADELTIHGYEGSCAETFAEDKGIDFNPLPEVVLTPGTHRYNAALGGRAFTDTPGPSANSPQNALTASTNSRFESMHGPRNMEITFTADLGRYYDIDQIRILWASANASATKFKLETATRLHGPYTEVYNVEDREAGREFTTTELNDASRKGVRYVRLTAYEKPATFGYSFNQFEVFGVHSAIASGFTGNVLDPVAGNRFSDVALNKTATSNTARNDPQLGINGNQLSRFESIHNRNNYEMIYEVDLHDVYSIEGIRILWDNDTNAATMFKIEVAQEYGNWLEVINVPGGNPVQRFDRSFIPVDARYVRLTAYEKTGQWGYSFREFEVLSRSSQ